MILFKVIMLSALALILIAMIPEHMALIGIGYIVLTFRALMNFLLSETKGD